MTPDPSDLNGKTLAVLVFELGDEDEDKGAIFFGIARYDGQQLVLDRGRDRPPFVVRDEWLSRIKPVPEDTDDIFEGAQYFLPLTIEPLPPGVDPSEEGYEETGLKWPSAKDAEGANAD